MNLRNKQYYFLNQKCTKEEYEQKMATLKLNQFSGLKNLRSEFAEIIKKYPQKYVHGVQNEDSTGDYISNTQRCHSCYDVMNAQDCKFVFNSRNVKMIYDMSVFGSKQGAEFCYENHEIGGGVQKIYFSDQVWSTCHDIYYSKLCIQGSKYLFGCVGLRRSEYCIFNKQYSKGEYEDLKARIIEHMKSTREWGEFFPIEMSPYGYNETIAQDYYPLAKEQALAKGYKWKDADQKNYRPQTYDIPDHIDNVKDDILSELLACIDCGKNFKIIPQELRFYRKMKLPIPRKCPDCRHLARMKYRNPRKLWNRKCDTCGIELKTTYSPDRPEKIHCDNCYLEAVV